MQIHEKIEQARLSANLTQDEMAEKLKIKRSTYQYWEKKTPTVEKVKKVAKVLGLPNDYFFGKNDEENDSHELIDETKLNTTLKLTPAGVTLQTLLNLSESNRILAEGSKIQAEARKIEAEAKNIHADTDKIIAKAQQELINIIRGKDGSIASAHERNEVETAATVLGMQKLLKQIAVTVLRISLDEVDAILNNNVKEAMADQLHTDRIAVDGS